MATVFNFSKNEPREMFLPVSKFQDLDIFMLEIPKSRDSNQFFKFRAGVNGNFGKGCIQLAIDVG